MTFLYSIKRKKAQKMVVKRAFDVGNKVLMIKNELNPDQIIEILTPIIRIENWYKKRNYSI